MNKTITLTSGHVSFKMGRVTRQYIPTRASLTRLFTLLFELERVKLATCHYTQRSSVYTVTQLSPMQKSLFNAWERASNKERKYYKLATQAAQKEHTYMHLISDHNLYVDYERELHFACGIAYACEIAGIPHAMIYPRSNEY